MAKFYRVIVTIPAASALPGDNVVNTFAFTDTANQVRTLASAGFNALLDSFYTAWVPTIGSSLMTWNSATAKYYDMQEVSPRFPFDELAVTPGSGNSAANDMPTEVAACLTIEGDKLSGTNMRRRRGRIYIGPLALASGDQTRLGNTQVDLISNAADTAFFGGVAEEVLAVYSRYEHHNVPVGERLIWDPVEKEYNYPEVPAKLADAFTTVTKVWVDNAFDTQRRRGIPSTYRKVNTP